MDGILGQAGRSTILLPNKILSQKLLAGWDFAVHFMLPVGRVNFAINGLFLIFSGVANDLLGKHRWRFGFLADILSLSGRNLQK